MAYGIELVSVTLEQMLFWINIEYIGIALIPAFWVLFCFRFTEMDEHLTRTKIGFIFSLPAVTLLMVWTNDWHHLHYASTSVSFQGDLTLLNIQVGAWYIIHTIIFYLYLLFGIFLLIKKYIGTNRIVKRQILMVLIAVSIPWIANIAYLIGIRPLEHIDITPYAFAATGIFISIGLVWFKLFEILPVAREQIISQTSEGILILNEGLRIIDANPAMVTVLGMNDIDVIGSEFKSVFGEENYMYRSLLNKTTRTVVWEKINKSGSINHYKVNVTRFVDKLGESSGHFLIFRDVTAEKLNETELIKAKKEAEEASQAKSNFLSHMSHEIRTPLSGIIGFIDLMKEETLSDDLNKYVTVVDASAKSLLHIVNEILDLSKIESGRMDIHLEDTDIEDMCRQAANLFAWQTNKSSIKTRVEIHPDTPSFIFTDKMKVRQVIINLLGNAMKFTEQGEIVLGTEVRKTDNKQIAAIRFFVRDSGIGIAEENKQKIFESFTQIHNSQFNQSGGTGLGLTISNKLLELLGSKLSLESTPGIGSTFSFEISVDQYDNSDLESVVKKKSEKSNKSKPEVLTILIAEDNLAMMVIISKMLEQLYPDSTIIKAKTGLEAYELFKSEQPDIIFMDLEMPELNGYEASVKIRLKKNSAKTPIIILSASDLHESDQPFDSNIINDYLTKPVEPETIKHIISKWVN